MPAPASKIIEAEIITTATATTVMMITIMTSTVTVRALTTGTGGTTILGEITTIWTVLVTIRFILVLLLI